ncbi:hypothetical protein GEMRC1_002652 [Eukaryota sp. GEM-RC1]
MHCFGCCKSFNLSSRLPLLVCGEGHSACTECSASLDVCPFCRIECLREKKPNSCILDLVIASNKGDLCPQISPDHILLGAKIAEDDFAVVFAAEWSDLPVAVKMVALTDKGKLELQKEMNLLYNLNHPSIIRVYGISFFNDSIVTLRYAKELCQGVKFLHLKSVVHGDLKPCNILLVDGHVKVADFGTSKTVSTTSLKTGKPAVFSKTGVSDELNTHYGPQCDIYSLGLIMYQILFGQEAFEGQVASQSPDINDSLPFDSSVPDCLKDLISKCFNSDPMLRPTINEITEIIKSVNVSDCDDQSFLIGDNDSSTLLINHNNCLIETVRDLERKLTKFSSFTIVNDHVFSNLKEVFSVLIDWNLMIPFDTGFMSIKSYLEYVSWILSSSKLPQWNSTRTSFGILTFTELPFLYFICALIEYHRDNNSELDLFLELIEDMSDHDVMLHNYTCKVEENDITSIVRPIFEYFEISVFFVDSFVQNASACSSIVDLFSELYIFLTNKQLYHQSRVIAHLQSLNQSIHGDQSTTALGFQLINSLTPTPEAKEAVLSHLSLEIEDSSLGRICTSWLKLAFVHDCPEELASENLITSEQCVLDAFKFFLSDPTPNRLRVIGALCDHFDPELLLQSNLFEIVSDPSVIGDVTPLIFEKLFEKLKMNPSHPNLSSFMSHLI